MIVAPLHPRVESDTVEDLFTFGGGQAEVKLTKDGNSLFLQVQEKEITAAVELDMDAAIHLREALRRYFKALRVRDVMESRGGY